jgi:hypothetical protein
LREDVDLWRQLLLVSERFLVVAKIRRTEVCFCCHTITGKGGTLIFERFKKVEGDPSVPGHTVYRPENLSGFGSRNPMPVVTWGNGGCANSSQGFANFLAEIASHSFRATQFPNCR